MKYKKNLSFYAFIHENTKTITSERGSHFHLHNELVALKFKMKVTMTAMMWCPSVPWAPAAHVYTQPQVCIHTHINDMAFKCALSPFWTCTHTHSYYVVSKCVMSPYCTYVHIQTNDIVFESCSPAEHVWAHTCLWHCDLRFSTHFYIIHLLQEERMAYKHKHDISPMKNNSYVYGIWPWLPVYVPGSGSILAGRTRTCFPFLPIFELLSMVTFLHSQNKHLYKWVNKCIIKGIGHISRLERSWAQGKKPILKVSMKEPAVCVGGSLM